MNEKNPKYLLTKIIEYITENSGFELKRSYISISHLSECPRKIVREYLDGFTLEEHTHRMAYAGYESEDNMKNMLRLLGFLETENVEVVAPFDERLRGHLDGVWEDSVIEIKSVSRRQFDKIVQKTDRIPWKHYVQVQMYMRYSGLGRALVFYRNRETYEHMVIAIPFNGPQALKFEDKAKHILAAIDDGRLPECECGKCEE